MAFETTQPLLSLVGDSIASYNRTANQDGQKFNIFKILKAERKELSTHSFFIYELLNPNGSHGMGRSFLQTFASDVLESEAPESAISPKMEDPTDKGRRIDFTLETDCEIFAIEMKIDAGDQQYQLRDYLKQIKQRASNKTPKVFYLTLRGSEPSQNSLGNIDISEVKLVSFEYHIHKWISHCIEISTEKPALKAALIQYLNLIDHLTGKNMALEELVMKDLILSKDNLSAGLMIEQSMPLTKATIQLNFWNMLIEKVTRKTQKEIYFYHAENKAHHNIDTWVSDYYRANSKQAYFFGICTDINGFKLTLLLADELNFYILGKTVGIRSNTANTLNQQAIDQKNTWVENDHYELEKPLSIKDPFDEAINFKTFNNPAIALCDSEVLKNFTEEVAEEFCAIFRQLDFLD